MSGAAEQVVVKAIQDLLELRESVDQQLGKCLARLQGVCQTQRVETEVESGSAVKTPSLELPLKRNFEDIDSTEASVNHSVDHTHRLPCRMDLSVWAQLFLQESVKNHTEVESMAGKKQKPCCLYGNYPNYYSYRNIDGAETDPRIQAFEKDWFHGRDCLDVGSHIGMLTLGLVTEFTPKSMTGIEIDSSLHKSANRLRSHLLRTCRENGQTDAFASLKRTRFINDDFLNRTGIEESFDVVTCLSVSKWIHFHHGDDGMKTMFQSFWDKLRKEGILIFEPQSLRSYKQVVKKQDMSSVPFPLAALKFHPDQFLSYLTEQVGFEYFKTVTLNASSKGFDRPIYILRKRL